MANIDLQTIAKNGFIFVDTSSMMCGQKAFFFFDLFGALQKAGTKAVFSSKAEEELRRYASFSETKAAAEEGLEVLAHLVKNGMAEFSSVEKPSDFLGAAIRTGKVSKVCLISEEKNEAAEFLSKTGADSVSVKIASGDPVEWIPAELGAVRAEPKPTTSFQLPICLVVDNCATMKGEKIERFRTALAAYAEAGENAPGPSAEFSVMVFEGFEARTLKEFGEPYVSGKLRAGGIPFLGEAIEKSLKGLVAYQRELELRGEACAKPWLIVLTDGENLGPVAPACETVRAMCAAGKLIYFPFALSDCEFDKSLADFRRLKKPLVIRDMQYEKLFGWLLKTSRRRLSTELSQSFGLDPKDFDGWVVK